MVGAVIAQAIPILVSPIMTRLYSPNDFGLIALFTSIVSIFTAISTGRYESTVMLPVKDQDALTLLVLTLLVTLLAAALSYIAILLFSDKLVGLVDHPDFSFWIYAIPIFVIFTAFYQPLNYWLNRKKLYRVMSSRSIIQSISGSLTSLGCGFGGLTRIGLFVGSFVGQSASLGMVGWQLWKEEKHGIKAVNVNALKQRAKEYKDFPLYAAPTSLLEVAYLQAPILYITYIYGAFYVGLFSLTMRVLSLPATFIGNAVGQVYYQRIATIRHEKPDALTRFILKSAGYLALIVAAPIMLIGLSGSFLFSFVFGTQWQTAGVFAQIMAVAIGLQVVVSPLSTIMSVSGNVKLVSKWKAICFCTTFITLYIASKYSIITFMIIYSGHEIIRYLIYFYLIIYASKRWR